MDDQDGGWRQFARLGLRRLTISHVTTKSPTSSTRKVMDIDITCDLGQLLLTRYPPGVLYAVCVVPDLGQLYITGDERNQIRMSLVADKSARPRPHNIVFDLDETLIFNPHHVGDLPPGAMPVNPSPPHYINDLVIDTPYLRPNVLPFLQLVCQYFSQVRVCTMSLRQRAQAVIRHMDPGRRTLLKNLRTEKKVVTCREDMVPQLHYSWHRGGPAQKGLEHCNLPAGSESRTVVLDDCWDIWPASLKENIVAVVPPQEMHGMPHDVYLNGADGGVLGKYILVCLVNMALKEERRPDLIIVELPVGIATVRPRPTPTPPPPASAPAATRPSQMWATRTPDRVLRGREPDRPDPPRPLPRSRSSPFVNQPLGTVGNVPMPALSSTRFANDDFEERPFAPTRYSSFSPPVSPTYGYPRQGYASPRMSLHTGTYSHPFRQF
eukprot:EG_transcript_9415